MKPLRFAASISATLVLLTGPVHAETTLNIATVNNADMTIMQELSKQFEEQNPDIKLDWQVFSENEIRQYLAKTYLEEVARSAKKGPSESPPPEAGQFDIVTIGTYDVPIWIKWGWLVPLESLPDSYDLGDVLQSVRDGLSDAGTLYALPFYGESSMTFYRTDLFEKAGIQMPAKPTYEEIAKFAAAVHDPDNEIYGICLRGKIGWGENMAYVSTLVNTFGGRWFDEQWNTALNTPEWKEAIGFYIDLLENYGPPSAIKNGYNENLQLFAQGHCGIWIDATVAAGYLFDPDDSEVADKVGFAAAPVAKTPKGSHWLWSWALAIPNSSKAPDARLEIHSLGQPPKTTSSWSVLRKAGQRYRRARASQPTPTPTTGRPRPSQTSSLVPSRAPIPSTTPCNQRPIRGSSSSTFPSSSTSAPRSVSLSMPPWRASYRLTAPWLPLRTLPRKPCAGAATLPAIRNNRARSRIGPSSDDLDTGA